jgi:hypothetical protein
VTGPFLGHSDCTNNPGQTGHTPRPVLVYYTMATIISDVLIIGAGLSGLVAARNLTRKGYRVLVLEVRSKDIRYPGIDFSKARDRIGGRAKTDETLGIPIDMGAAAIHGYDEGNPVRALCAELNLVQ